MTSPAGRANPSCTDLSGLTAHDGQVVLVGGTFVFPKEKAFARNKLSLSDGTVLILAQPADRSVRARLTSANDGKRMSIRGRVFTGAIPQEYRIIGRTPDPYLVDIVDVDVDG